MQISTLVFASTFALIHLVLFAPFVAVDHVVPSALGAFSLSCMALTLVLAARWRLVDHVMGGPDKSYLAHRWLGLFALAGAMGHWAMDALDGAGLIPFLSESGEGAGTIAALGLIWMTAAALVRAIPYHLWKLSHMLMGPIFALAAYHALLVTSPQSIGATPWAVMAVMSVVGLVGWGQTLLRKRNPARRVTVSRVSRFEGGVDITLTSETEMPPFRPGQFATLAHNRARAEAHPFTIAGGMRLPGAS
ncbi:ferric reductase-like transmembrane domain-containing protein [Roseobacteraceae bacterium S113]